MKASSYIVTPSRDDRPDDDQTDDLRQHEGDEPDATFGGRNSLDGLEEDGEVVGILARGATVNNNLVRG